jgi:hypothetical protein
VTTAPTAHPLDSLPPTVAIDRLFDDGPDAMVDLCERFGTYHTYGQHEQIDLDIGRGLSQRHDSILYFLRTGGLRAASEPPAVLAARTAYFREEYAYGDDLRIAGIAGFLHHPAFIAAAQQIHGRPVVQPAIAYANLMVPGQELAVHTDVPEFRGINRKVVPQWLLVVMHHSGLFDDWRLHIATGIAWFHDSDHGALAYWPDGPDRPAREVTIRATTALVLASDSIFHGVDRVTDASAAIVPDVRTGSTLRFAGDERWELLAPDGDPVTTYHWDELRFSVSWKAYCFADEAARAAWADHTDDLDVDTVVDRLVADLAERGVVEPDVARDPGLGLAMIDTYIRFPDPAGPAV